MIYNKSIIEEINRRFNNGELVKRDETPYFRGEIGVRKAYLSYSYNEEEISEFVKCSTDIFYFAEKYCQITSENGIVGIKLRDYQINYLNDLNNNKFILHVKSREIGSVLLNAIKLLHYSLFNNDKNILIVANVADTTVELFDKIKDIYINLPFFLKMGVKSWNKSSINFENGCRLIAKSMKNVIIGFTVDYLHIEEFAHMSAENVNTFYTVNFPIISALKNSKLVISSTPNGEGNLFHKLYLDSKREENDKQKNSFKLIETPYSVIPNRDHKWVDETIKSWGGNRDIFEQEYNLKFLPKKNLEKDIEKVKIDNNKIMAKLNDIEKLLLQILTK
jgi:hypothetical protein